MQNYLAIIFFVFYSCKPIEPVDFVEIKNVKINNSTDNQLFINAEIILNNPNRVKITIDNIDVDIYADNIVLVNINEKEPRELIESSLSPINIKGEINLKNLEEFFNKKGLAIILGKDDISLKFIGKIQAKAYGIKDEIDINYSIDSVKGLIK